MEEITCIQCGAKFDCELWTDVKCPKCGKTGDWEEQEIDNGEDYYAYVEWD